MWIGLVQTRTACACLLAAVFATASVRGAEPPPPRAIVASFYPLYVALLNIVGVTPGVQVANLAPVAAGCPEDYQLSPADLKLLHGADVLVINGAGFENYLGKVAAQCPRLRVVDASAGLSLLKVNGETNPHLWASPAMAARQTRVITAALAAADPAQAASYQSNGEAYALKLEALAAQMRAALAAAPVRKIVAFHDSLFYLARDLGLEIIAVIETAPGQAPGARELAAIVQRVRSTSEPVALLNEQDAKNPAAEILSRELGRPLFTLDTVTGGPLDSATARTAYLRAMQNNLSVLREALGLKSGASPPVILEKP